MPEARSISCAAWAPVSPRKVRTREYVLNADFVRQLAHSDRASAEVRVRGGDLPTGVLGEGNSAHLLTKRGGIGLVLRW